MWDRERGMSSTAAGIVTYRGAVYASHCDHIGHMNIASYGAKFDEATWVLFCELGLTPSYLRGEHGMAAVQQAITYKKELFAGDVIEIRGKEKIKKKAAEAVEILVHGRGEFRRVRAPVDAGFARAVDDLVVDVGDVAHVGHAQTAVPQVAADHVEHHQHACVADVEIVVHRDAAAVHAHVTRLDGLQFLLRARQGVVYSNHAKRFRRS